MGFVNSLTVSNSNVNQYWYLRKLHVGVVSRSGCRVDFICLVSSCCYYEFVSDVLAFRNL